VPEQGTSVGGRRLAAELRRLREHAGLTGEEASERLGWSGSKLSRIELHRIGVKQADLRKLLALYGTYGLVVSTDAGKSWKLGGIVGPDCNECQTAELSDGRVLLNMRTVRKTNRRLVAVSADGGETFAEPVEDAALVEPACQASLIRLGKGVLAFSNPASTKREKMTVRLSPDDGKTWPHGRVLYEGPAAYSCLSVLPDGRIGCLYERGEKGPYERIVLARFSRDWVAGQK